MDRSYYVYILTNKTHRVLYTGVTNNLERRLYEHRTGVKSGFTQKYNCHKLVWFEITSSINDAIAYEKKIKAGSREGKLRLITASNPNWKDLSAEWESV